MQEASRPAKVSTMIRAGSMPQGDNHENLGRHHTNPEEGLSNPTLMMMRSRANLGRPQGRAGMTHVDHDCKEEPCWDHPTMTTTTTPSRLQA